MVLESSGGGAGRHVLDLCRGLSSRSHQVVLAYSPKRAERTFVGMASDLPIDIVELRMDRAIGLHDLKSAARLARLVKDRGPFDIVHGHSAKAGALVRCVPTGGAKIVYTPHAFRSLDPDASWATRNGYLSIERTLGRRTDALIAVSRAELEFAANHQIANGRRFLVYNGLFPQPVKDVADVRLGLGYTSSDIVVGFVGRLTYQKAPDRFIDAMIGAMSSDERFRALMIGDGELRADVAARISASGLADRFRLLSGTDARPLIGALDYLMISSRYEGFSYVTLEALDAGVPLIATPVGGVKEAIGTTDCGIVVEHLDKPTELTAAVIDLAIKRSDQQARKERARARAADFAGDSMVDQTEAVYRAVLTPSSVGPAT